MAAHVMTVFVDVDDTLVRSFGSKQITMISVGMRTITPQDAAGWIRHCGYTGHAT